MRTALYQLANWKIILLCAIPTLWLSAYIFPNYQAQLDALAGTPVPILDLRLGYTLAEVLALFEQLGPEGRALYAAITWPVDMVYPIVYGVFFLLCLAALLKPYGKGWGLLVLPLLVVGFDYLENMGVLRLLAQYPELAATDVAWCSWMTCFKWLFLGLTAVALIGLLVLRLLKRPSSTAI